MSKIVVKYQCQHISCRNPSCYRGEITLPKDKFDVLKQQDANPKFIRSPSNYCILGTSQQFEILESQEIENEKAPPAEVLRILQSKLAETKAAKSKIVNQIAQLQSVSDQADKNILSLEKKIVDLTTALQNQPTKA